MTRAARPALATLTAPLFAALCLLGTIGADRAVAADHDTVAAGGDAAYPDLIVARRPGFGPEGIEFDTAGRRILVGSLREGAVFEVRPDGTVVPFIDDPDLNAAVGIEVDEARNRIAVCNSDMAALNGARGQAKLGIYALDTGKRLAMLDLTAALPFGAENFFANDIARDASGNLYVSDSAARIIYTVTPDFEVGVIAPADFLNPQNFFLNGLVHHPDGYLLAAEMRHGRLYKVATDGSERVSIVDLPEVIIGADGLTWRDENELVVVSNQTDRVSIFTSDDGWASARLLAQTTLDRMATTAAIIDGEIFVVHAHFRDETPPDAYEISRVTFE